MSKYREWKDPAGMTESVKLGWSWPAFLFGGLWAIAKRMTLIGICTLLGGLAISYTIAATLNDEDDILWLVSTILVSLFFGANGNSWRERHLRKRGFVPSDIEEKPFLIHVRTLLAHPVIGLRTLSHDTVWSKVIAGIILAVLGVGGAYVLHRRSAADRLDNSDIASHHHSVQGCKHATIYGGVETNGETFAWFEWGGDAQLRERDYQATVH